MLRVAPVCWLNLSYRLLQSMLFVLYTILYHMYVYTCINHALISMY